MPESSTQSASTQFSRWQASPFAARGRRVYQKRSGLFFRADKQKVLAETVGKSRGGGQRSERRER